MFTGCRENVHLTFGEQQRLKKVAERTERQRILQLTTKPSAGSTTRSDGTVLWGRSNSSHDFQMWLAQPAAG